MKSFTIASLAFVFVQSVYGTAFVSQNLSSSFPSATATSPSSTVSRSCASDVSVKLSAANSGYFLLKTPINNKFSSFSAEERVARGLTGLVPAGEPISLDNKVANAMNRLRELDTPIAKYNFMHQIQDADETLYYALITRNVQEIMPIVYTPVVGEACQKWGEINRACPRGLYLSMNDLGNLPKILEAWPHDDIKAIVVTDGERILGLGDLGVNGMGIPIGKLALYTACAGIHPSQCLPVHIDVGTNNENYLMDPMYMGLRQKRENGPRYDQLIKEFFEASAAKYGKNVLIQFEDFGNSNAFRLLDDYKNDYCTFNDDIQGTASVVLAGILASLRVSKDVKTLAEHKFVFLGAGEAGVGIANLIAEAVVAESNGKINLDDARKQIYLVDSSGLVSSDRDQSKLAHHKLPYSHTIPDGSKPSDSSLLAVVKALKPTAIIGVSAQPHTFTEEVVKTMAENNESPVIFALSNPTSRAECTAEQAYTWTNGKCIFASGSPFDSVTLASGETREPGQGNNAYIFPGVGLAAILAGSTRVTDLDMYTAAKALAAQVSQEQLDKGNMYPPLNTIREVSSKIAAAVAESMYETGVATVMPKPTDMVAAAKSIMYNPEY